MKLKEYIKNLLMNFFIVVTLVNVAMAVLGLIYDADRTFSYEAYFSPLIYGFLSMLPSAVLYSKKELSTRQMFIRTLLQITMIEIFLLGFMIANGISEPRLLFPLAVAILLVSFAVLGIQWLLDTRSAKDLNQRLAEYQNSKSN